MYLGDNKHRDGIESFASEFTRSGNTAQVQLVKIPNPKDFGVAEFDENGSLKRLVEKPLDPPSDWALAGIYFFNHKIIEAVHAIKPSKRGELEITDAIQWLLDQGFPVGHQMMEGWWKDTGQPADLLEANVLVLQDLRGSFDQSAIIDSESQLIGEVQVGSGVQI